VVGYNFSMIYIDSGPLNQILAPFLERFGIDPRIRWLSHPVAAQWAIILADVWQWTSLTFLIFLSGFAALPRQLVNAARVMGASPWQTFWRVELPLLKPAIVIAVIIRSMEALKLFDPVVLLTFGGPGTSTQTVAYFLWEQVWVFNKFSLERHRSCSADVRPLIYAGSTCSSAAGALQEGGLTGGAASPGQAGPPPARASTRPCTPRRLPRGRPSCFPHLLDGVVLQGGGEWWRGRRTGARPTLTATPDFLHPWRDLARRPQIRLAIWAAGGLALICTSSLVSLLLGRSWPTGLAVRGGQQELPPHLTIRMSAHRRGHPDPDVLRDPVPYHDPLFGVRVSLVGTYLGGALVQRRRCPS
jgi:hypothetical protein